MKALMQIAEPAFWEEDEEAEGWVPDFRVSPLKDTRWQIAILSLKASQWARSRSRSTIFAGEEVLTTDDLSSVNLFVSAARNFGMKVEYVGPHQIVRF